MSVFYPKSETVEIMKQKSVIIVGAVVSALLIFLIYTTWLLARRVPIEIQGEAEARQVKVSSKVTGRIDSMGVYRGQTVIKGDFLFSISSPEVEAKMSQAMAVKSAAEAQQLKAVSGAQKEDIQAAYNSYLKAAAALEFAGKSHTRIKNLYESGVVPEHKLDETEMQLRVARETAGAASALWEKAKGGARSEDKDAAGAMVKQAEAVIAEISSYVNETLAVAPISGEVANILSEEGELTPAGFPVITLVDLEDVWVVFNIREDLLAGIEKGARFEARFPALAVERVLLEVTYISVMGDFATWNATKASGDFDMKTFEVHARPVGRVDGLRPGMSALVDWDKIADMRKKEGSK